MKAAVVSAFDHPPRYEDVPDPVTSRDDELVVDVVAAGLHPRVRSQADGSHYTSTGELPLVPGIDGVGRDGDGRLRYFVLPDTTLGSLAEWTVIDVRRSIVLPDDADPVTLAAAMNPAMSSWVALRRRIEMAPGARVLVLGATGNAGRMAVQVARRLGAGHVTGVGRDRATLGELAALGADRVVAFDDAGALGDAGEDVDVVLDYVWGQPTVDALYAIIPRRRDDVQRLTWVQIGSMAGLEAPIPSAALRAARLEIVGSGQGSVPARDIVAELPLLAEEIGRGTFTVDAEPRPLAEVERAWADAATTSRRIVLVP